jgi:ribosomal protein L35AE/L33A
MPLPVTPELAALKAIGNLGNDIFHVVEIEGRDLFVSVYREDPMGPRGSFRMQFSSKISPQRLGEVVRAAASAAFPVENPS